MSAGWRLGLFWVGAATSLACSSAKTPSMTVGSGSSGDNGSASGSVGTSSGSSGSVSVSGVGGGTGVATPSSGFASGSSSGVATGGSQSSGAASGVVSSGNASGSGAATGASGAMAVSGSGSGTTADDGGNPNYPPETRAINVQPGGVFQTNFNGQNMYLDHSKPIQGKLVLYLGGLGAFNAWVSGSGGFDAFVKKYFGGFHMFMPATNTGLVGGSVPQSYVTTLQTDPMNMEANRQVGDSRMELWDGVTRVNWYSVPAGKSIVAETVAAIQYAMATGDPGGDWGYYLDSAGTGLRTSDVWVVGYSWGSQTWAMISAYVPFGRVIDTSGPQDEGFPNALWVTQPSANGTPGDRKYMLLGFDSPYPSAAGADAEVMGMVQNVSNAGWGNMVTNVNPTGTGTFASPQRLFSMVGSNGASPGGHTVFCTDGPANGWDPLCSYVMTQ
jgi:hypothetical protein